MMNHPGNHANIIKPDKLTWKQKCWIFFSCECSKSDFLQSHDVLQKT